MGKLMMILALLAPQEPDRRTFDDWKPLIAKHESANGKWKLHINKNQTVDCGIYQINSSHFVGDDTVSRSFNRIFARHRVGRKLHSRVVAAIVNDKLNEELARELFRIRGIRAWTSLRKGTN